MHRLSLNPKFQMPTSQTDTSRKSSPSNRQKKEMIKQTEDLISRMFTTNFFIDSPGQFSLFWQGMESPVLCAKFLSKVGKFLLDVSRDPYKVAKDLKIDMESLFVMLTCMINTAHLLDQKYAADVTVDEYVQMITKVKKFRSESKSLEDPRISKLFKIFEKSEKSSDDSRRNLGIPLIGECTALGTDESESTLGNMYELGKLHQNSLTASVSGSGLISPSTSPRNKLSSPRSFTSSKSSHDRNSEGLSHLDNFRHPLKNIIENFVIFQFNKLLHYMKENPQNVKPIIRDILKQLKMYSNHIDSLDQVKLRPQILTMMHLLKLILTLHPTNDLNFLIAIRETVTVFYSWQYPCSKMAKSLLSFIEEELLSPGIHVQSMIMNEWPVLKPGFNLSEETMNELNEEEEEVSSSENANLISLEDIGVINMFVDMSLPNGEKLATLFTQNLDQEYHLHIQNPFVKHKGITEDRDELDDDIEEFYEYFAVHFGLDFASRAKYQDLNVMRRIMLNHIYENDFDMDYIRLELKKIRKYNKSPSTLSKSTAKDSKEEDPLGIRNHENDPDRVEEWLNKAIEIVEKSRHLGNIPTPGSSVQGGLPKLYREAHLAKLLIDIVGEDINPVPFRNKEKSDDDNPKEHQDDSTNLGGTANEDVAFFNPLLNMIAGEKKTSKKDSSERSISITDAVSLNEIFEADLSSTSQPNDLNKEITVAVPTGHIKDVDNSNSKFTPAVLDLDFKVSTLSLPGIGKYSIGIEDVNKYAFYSSDLKSLEDIICKQITAYVPQSGVKSVIKIPVLGSNAAIHSMICALTQLSIKNPELYDMIDLSMFVIPFGQNDLSQYIALQDVWYRRYIYAVFSETLPVCPQFNYFTDMDKQAILENGMGATYPMKFMRETIQHYVRFAEEEISIQTYDCLCWSSMDSNGTIVEEYSHDVIVPFLSSVEIGLRPAAALFQKNVTAENGSPDVNNSSFSLFSKSGNSKSSTGSSVTFEDILMDKRFIPTSNTNLPEVAITATIVDLDGKESEEPYEIENQAFASLKLSNLSPLCGDLNNLPSNSHEFHRSYVANSPSLIMRARSLNSNFTDAFKRQKRTRKDIDQVVELLRDGSGYSKAKLVSKLEISVLKVSDSFHIAIDSVLYGPFCKVEIRPREQSNKSSKVKIKTFLPPQNY